MLLCTAFPIKASLLIEVSYIAQIKKLAIKYFASSPMFL